MKKRVIFGIVLFLFIGFFAFTFANPNEKVSDENKVVDKRDDSVVDNEKNKGTDLKNTDILTTPIVNHPARINVVNNNENNDVLPEVNDDLKEYKEEAIKEINDYKDSILFNDNYSVIAIILVNGYEDKINLSNTKDEIDELVVSCKDDLDSLKKVQDLNNLKSSAKKEINDYNKDVLYSDENSELIESIKKEAIDKIDSINNEDEINSLIENTKKKIDEIEKLKDTYFKVVFKDDRGNIISEQSILYGEHAIKPEEKEYEVNGILYSLVSWSDDFSSITKDMTITGKYNITNITAKLYRVSDDFDIKNKATSNDYIESNSINLKINEDVLNVIKENKDIDLTTKINSYVDSVLPHIDDEYYFYNFYKFEYSVQNGFYIEYQKTFDFDKYYQDRLSLLNKLLDDDYSKYKDTKTTDSYNNLINTIESINIENITIDEIEKAISDISTAIDNLVDIELTGISISRNNDIYYLNQSMNDIVITALYNDSTRNKQVIDYSMSSSFDSTSYGDKSIIYSYQNKEVTYSYKVNYTDQQLNDMVKNTTAFIKKNETCTGRWPHKTCEYSYILGFNNLNTSLKSISVIGKNGNKVDINVTLLSNGIYSISENNYDLLKGNNTLFMGNVIKITYTINNQEITKEYVEYFNNIKPRNW